MLKVVIPEVQTETIKGIQYRVLETNNILCEFYDLDTAKNM